jgi:D-alanyl-D-alanine carboxypeptidase/D-alanyl-D-alanine-endopeptidase (penicillin-binding protein 4)
MIALSLTWTASGRATAANPATIPSPAAAGIQASTAPSATAAEAPPGPATAPIASAPVAPSIEALRERVDGILARGRYSRASWGLLAVSLDRGDTLLIRNVDTPLVPASNLKVLTSAAALHYLGPDYRFTTWVLTRGEVVDSVLEGDLVLYGTGDPGTADRFHENAEDPYRELARQLLERGIRQVRGRVMGDGTLFRGPLRGEGWNPRDVNEWFSAASGALSFNENVASVRIRPGAVGEPPVIETIPEQTGLLFTNEGRTVAGRGRRPVWLLRDELEDPIRLVGEMSVSARDIWRQMTVADPALMAAHVFRQVLIEEGIGVEGPPGTIADPEASPLTSYRFARSASAPLVLAQVESPPLSDYLRAVNQRSHNLYADLFLKTLGKLVADDGSFPGGSRVLSEFLTGVVGVPPEQINIVDGSGLSILNRASAGTMVSTIRFLDAGPNWDPFWESLPVAGSRQLFRRMSRTAAAGNLRAKTGTMNRVSSLSGVVRSADGERIVFSIIGNDLPSETGAKRLENDVGRALAEWRR